MSIQSRITISLLMGLILLACLPVCAFAETSELSDGDEKGISLSTTVPPSIISGAGAVYEKGGASGLTFKTDDVKDNLLQVLVDGKVISPDNYTAFGEPLAVTLHAGYLDTLSAGEHTIEIVTVNESSVSTQFSVYKSQTPSQTGEDPADRTAFEKYKDSQKHEIDQLSQEGDNDVRKQLITDAKADIDVLAYDERKSLDENKAAVDEIMNLLVKSLEAQRAADQTDNDKAAFDQYKAESIKAADLLSKEDDSETCKKMIETAKADIDAQTYNESKTLEENIAPIKDILSKLITDLKDQREKDNTSSGGCYVATCVYGSYDCPEVWTLRRYRDNVLAKTWYGRAFIKTYYTVSPTIVKLVGDTDWFQSFWRARLDKMVSDLQADGFASTPYQDRDW